ncbi:MAG TPA: FlhC family transcriptional regulator [Povalibacter sp.]|nr:FlhC family transcriptional regulator [Povalibacter sp.]
MHISNERYFRDRRRHDLALRMIRHEARTQTIRSCTGLTDDRIRRLFKTYTRHQPNPTVRRRRGKSPRQIAYFTRNVHMQFEASCLSSVFAAFGLLRCHRSTLGDETSLECGERFCDAFETHRQVLPGARISFEHAWFLLQLLNRGASLRPVSCRHCSSRYLRDRLNAAARHCPFCELKSPATEAVSSPPAVPAERRRRPVASGGPSAPVLNVCRSDEYPSC